MNTAGSDFNITRFGRISTPSSVHFHFFIFTFLWLQELTGGFFFLFLFLFTEYMVKLFVCLWRTRNPDHLDTSVKIIWLITLHFVIRSDQIGLYSGISRDSALTSIPLWMHCLWLPMMHPGRNVSMASPQYDSGRGAQKSTDCFQGHTCLWSTSSEYILPLWSSTILLRIGYSDSGFFSYGTTTWYWLLQTHRPTAWETR